MEHQQGDNLDQDPTPTEDPNVKGPVEMTLTWSEHDQIVQRLRLYQTNRYNALDFALRQSAGFPTSPKNVVENAAHYLSFLSEESPESVNQRTYQDGFTAGQESMTALNSYQTGAEDRQKLVLKRVHKLLLAEAQRYAPDERVTVKQAYDRVNEMLGFANWEF